MSLTRIRALLVVLVLATWVFACDGSQREPLSTRSHTTTSATATPTPTPQGPAPASEGTTPVGGPLASLTITPANATVVAGLAKQFSVTAADASGNAPYPYPSMTWSVSGGGTIGMGGLFSALTAGGPYTITVTAGGKTATATVSVTPGPVPTFKIGETATLDNDDSGGADMLLAQQATLDQPATIRSLSFYVADADGNLRLGIYDATGPNGGPGALRAETAEFAAEAGWNAVEVVTPVLLPKGSYWLAFAPSSNDLHFLRSGDGTGMMASMARPYQALPASFDPGATIGPDHWSFYASLTP
jgi:hypothetical protein